MSVVSCQLSVVSCQLSVVSVFLSVFAPSLLCGFARNKNRSSFTSKFAVITRLDLWVFRMWIFRV
ncbi:MAG: hypothetical protein ACKPA8_04430 [Dolichospermum sp.]